ncbi:MAG: hypothetical protein KF819_23535 [Labilithrix sp.]|nr:hypothetical protein [Labilithrix sp.]
MTKDAAAVAAVHAIACVIVLALGFDHVSDDDFARVTIAQSFAHAPRLDPSGTSWLPFPFWTMGATMAIFGRSLAVARVFSVGLASLALALPLIALRMTGAPRRRALAAIAFAAIAPWSLWLGAATVPESFTASFTAAAVLALGRPSDNASPRARFAFASLLLAACLSRYETWPVAIVLAIATALRSRSRRQTAVTCAILLAGPVLWMAHNLHAHGSALHFFTRVAAFKRAIGEGSTDASSALLMYPRLLATTRPDVVAATAGALLALRSKTVRRRWLVPLACAAAQIAFLSYGNARDGAPAHHAERALLAPVLILAAFAADVLLEAAPDLLSTRRPQAIGGAVVLAACWLLGARASLREVPGASPSEDRTAQLAEGQRLREAGAPRVVVTPCAFEHFALVAAYGAPERVETLPRTGAAVGPECPAVERR